VSEIVKEFRAFVLRGNVVDLAVAVVIGAAFGALVASLVENLLTPLIAAIFGQPDFSRLTFTINDSTFRYGAFLNSVISFVLIAAAVFFVVVKPLSVYLARRQREEEATTKACPECLSEIPIGAKRCAFCASEVPPA
jgi:large conductance mechanosensitive channel